MVKAQWFELITQSPRCYRLQLKERTLVVHEMIRLAGIKFEKVQKHSRRLAPNAADLEGRWDSPLGADQHYLSEDSHNCFEALVRDNQAENVRVRDISAVGNA